MKKQLMRLAALCVALAALAGCAFGRHGAAAPSSGPADGEEGAAAALDAIHALGTSPDDDCRIWYEIFVYSFCDSDGNGIGDLRGVEQKLDYLQQLGITGIWLMPVSPSPSYHKYDVTDYEAIDPQYGTMADLESLLTACHQRGIRLILDLVVNHTSSQHPWFAAAAEYLRALPAGAQPDAAVCPYVDYYNFIPAAQKTAGYELLTGTEWAYEAQFGPAMPDLNWDSSAVHSEVQQVMAYWLDKGVDGFRLDAVKEYYTGNTDKSIEVLRWITQTAQAARPGVYMVAEVWSDFATVTRYYESGVPSVFDYPFGNADGQIVKTLRGAGRANVVQKYAASLQKAETAYRGAGPSSIDAPFLSNHDTGRIYGFVSGDENKVKLAGAMNLFMGGSAFVYYGEELGMPGSGNDPSKRAPMYWNDARSSGTTQPPPQCTLPEYPFGSLESQQSDAASVYNYYRQAIAIRNALPQIARGTSAPEPSLGQGCVSAIRKTWNDRSCVILYNISDTAVQIDLSGEGSLQLAASLSANGDAVTLSGQTLTLPAYGTAVLV